MTSKIIAAVAATVGVSLAAAGGAATQTSPQADRARQLVSRLSVQRAWGLTPPGGGARRGLLTSPPADHPQAFASGCAILPGSGPGSRAALASAPVAAALGQLPALSVLTEAIRLSGLTKVLNAARSLTVFAPDNAAFEGLGAGNLQTLLATRPDLVRVLKFHLVAGRVTPSELARPRVFTTVGGTKLYLARYGASLFASNATVTCGNVQTSNASVYVVSRLIVPGS